MDLTDRLLLGFFLYAVLGVAGVIVAWLVGSTLMVYLAIAMITLSLVFGTWGFKRWQHEIQAAPAANGGAK
jgi:CHASE2 domain-containing sensor protein